MVDFKMIKTLLIPLIIPFGGNCQMRSVQSAIPEKPNFIIILADDLGYGDLGCYGSIKVKTPHIDILAKEGLRFTDFHSNGAVCSPTRAALLTGRYQQRMGITSALGEGEKGLGGPEAKNEITIAQYLKEAGYHTGIIGKWHLGYNKEQNPIHFGFDEFRGMLHGAVDYHSHINTFGRFDWWNNEKLVNEEGYITHLVTDHTIDLIEKWKDGPFFLYVSHLAIHFPWQTPDDEAHREEGKKYRDVSGSLNRLGPHPPEKSGEVVRIMIEELDKSVGKIMAKLKQLNIDKQTLVFFMSDNGGIITYSGGYTEISSNGQLRGAKSQIYEGGHRVPAIVRWPEKIETGVTSQVVMSMDITPTIMTISGIEFPKNYSKNKLDGVDLSPLLFKHNNLPQRSLFWKHGNSLAVRSGDWKLIVFDQNKFPELYDLNSDLGEKNNAAYENSMILDSLYKKLIKWNEEMISN